MVVNSSSTKSLACDPPSCKTRAPFRTRTAPPSRHIREPRASPSSTLPPLPRIPFDTPPGEGGNCLDSAIVPLRPIVPVRRSRGDTKQPAWGTPRRGVPAARLLARGIRILNQRGIWIHSPAGRRGIHGVVEWYCCSAFLVRSNCCNTHPQLWCTLDSSVRIIFIILDASVGEEGRW